MARITIIGGHGKVALRLARLLVARGDEVTSWIRNPDHRDDVERTGARALIATGASDPPIVAECSSCAVGPNRISLIATS